MYAKVDSKTIQGVITGETTLTTEKDKIKLKATFSSKDSLSYTVNAVVKNGVILELMHNHTAGEFIPQYSVVKLESDSLIYLADATIAGDVNKVIGISLDEIPAGNSGRVLYKGLITNPSFSLTPGSLFLSISGTFSYLPPPNACFTQVVGQAISTTELLVDIRDADLYSANSYTLVTLQQDTSAFRCLTFSGELASSYTDKPMNLLSINSYTAGSVVRGLVEGIVENDTWNFIPNQAIFLGDYGLITQTPISVGQVFMQKLGKAITPTKINLNIEQPIYL